MKYEILRMASFRKDIKLLLKRGKDLERLLSVIDKLANDEPLDDVYRDHALSYRVPRVPCQGGLGPGVP